MKRFAQVLIVAAIAFASYQTGQQRGVEYGKTLAPIGGNMTFAYDDGEGWDLNFVAMATDQQVQTYVNERLRVRAEQFRALVNACRDDKLAIEDIYQNVAQQNPTWTDNRTDGPPSLLDSQDVLVYNTVLTRFLNFVDGTLTDQTKNEFGVQWPVFQQACVRSVN